MQKMACTSGTGSETGSAARADTRSTSRLRYLCSHARCHSPTLAGSDSSAASVSASAAVVTGSNSAIGATCNTAQLRSSAGAGATQSR